MTDTRPRLASLDVLRGLTIVGMIVVNSAAFWFYAEDAPVFPALMHAHWRGYTLADAVFPAFVFMTGVSIPLALGAAGEGLSGPTLRRLLVRTGRLFLLGVILSNIFWMATPDSVIFRPMGVLQRLALAFLAAAILYKLLGPRARLTVAVVLLLAYWPLCLAPYPGGHADLATPGANLVGWIDRLFLNGHTYVGGPLGYDPEGLVSTFPAIAQALLGVAAGEWLINRRGPLGLLAAGVALVAAGLAWGLVFPISKELWTSSFVLLSTGVPMILLAGLHGLLDLKGARLPGARVLSDFGINAVFAYSLHMLTSEVPGAGILKIAYAKAVPVVGAETAALIPIAVYVALIWLVLAYMRRRGWIVKV